MPQWIGTWEPLIITEYADILHKIINLKGVEVELESGVTKDLGQMTFKEKMLYLDKIIAAFLAAQASSILPANIDKINEIMNDITYEGTYGNGVTSMGFSDWAAFIQSAFGIDAQTHQVQESVTVTVYDSQHNLQFSYVARMQDTFWRNIANIRISHVTLLKSVYDAINSQLTYQLRPYKYVPGVSHNNRIYLLICELCNANLLDNGWF